ncbi:MAG: hypothetical protein ACRDN6_02765 [Gaiellaceae bacterium]
MDDLVRAGTLERTASDTGAARIEIESAQAHLRSAESLAGDDPIMAYTALYDAARKAVTAHMRAHGIRVKGVQGYHAKTFAYAEAALGHLPIADHVTRLDDMRRLRNAVEYRQRRVSAAEVEVDLASAREIVAAIDDDLG